MLYCPGKGQELLSALGVNLECHASSIFLVLKPPLSIIDASCVEGPASLTKCFNTRKKEHLRNVKTAAKGSRIANHVWANSHAIDFDNASIIDKGGFRTRKILEAWHSKLKTVDIKVFFFMCCIHLILSTE